MLQLRWRFLQIFVAFSEYVNFSYVSGNIIELIIYFHFSADGKYEVTLMTKARLNYTGEIEWKPPAIYKSSCKINVEWLVKYYLLKRFTKTVRP